MGKHEHNHRDLTKGERDVLTRILKYLLAMSETQDQIETQQLVAKIHTYIDSIFQYIYLIYSYLIF